MWKDFFLYTKSERRGIVILVVLIVLVLLFRFTMPYWDRFSSAQETNKEFEKRIFEINDSLISQQEKQQSTSLFYFDPNTVTESELSLLGFSKYQQKTFLGYRNKIGHFKNKDEILNVYGIDSLFMSVIAPYILFEKIQIAKEKKNKEVLEWINFNKVEDKFWLDYISSNEIRDSIRRLLAYHDIIKSLPLYKVREYPDEKLFFWLKSNMKPRFLDNLEQKSTDKFELNSADTIVFEGIKGIGRKLATRICKFRNLLGGYYKKEQLKEVYGISEELYRNIEMNIYVDEKLVHKINPGKDGINAIRKHPYFTERQSKELFNLYRKNKKPTISDVSLLSSITDEDVERMKMYLLLFE